MKQTPKRQTLPVQMVITLVGLVIMTAVAIGIPAILLIRDQFSRHAMEMLNQGSRTAEMLIVSQGNDLANLALLTAQRPTLQRLIIENQSSDLQSYLDVLRRGVDLDLVLLCTPGGETLLPARQPFEQAICRRDGLAGLVLTESDGGAQGWLLAAESVPGNSEGVSVVVGRAVDDALARLVSAQTGMEASLAFDSQVLAASRVEANEVSPAAIVDGSLYTLGSETYYTTHLTEPETGLQVVLFFSAGEMHAARRTMSWQIGAGIFLVILLGSGLGVLRARQISKPLAHLRQAADGLRRGDLTSPIRIETRVREAAEVGIALDDARSALLSSLEELRQEKAWVEHLLESVVEGILTVDRRGRINFFSKGAERITGRPATEVLGRTIDDVFEVRQGDIRFSQQIPAPGRRNKIVVILAGGRQVTLSVTGASLAPPEAGRAGAVLVLRDVSDEEAIRRLLGEFLANISHEFRTPLTALAASIEMLVDQLPDLSQAELSQLVESIYLGVVSLQTLIDNLLEGASIETGRFKVYPRPADVSEIVSEAVHTMRPLANKYQQQIKLELENELPGVQADPRRTGQVLINLLSNAVKWGPPGGTIAVTVIRQAPDCLKVMVTDQGPGLPPGTEQDLFRRFDRIANKEGRGESGAGLGLSVVKAIVEAQGGSVGAGNVPGSGASFWFTLPVGEPALVRGEAASHESADR